MRDWSRQDNLFTFGSLFAGIGGFDLGLERAGMQCRWQVEIDPWARRVLAKHWPDVPKFGDIRELTGDELEPVDLICGGFPCQPFSLAGKGEAEADDRYLWPEALRLFRRLRPRYALLENVPGLLGRGLGRVLGDLAEIGCDAEWECIPACAVGAHHIRDRVWVCAYPKSAERGWASRESGYVGILGRAARVEHDIYLRSEPEVGRVAHGIPGRVDRLRGLGNAVVPQIPELLGRWILEAEAQRY